MAPTTGSPIAGPIRRGADARLGQLPERARYIPRWSDRWRANLYVLSPGMAAHSKNPDGPGWLQRKTGAVFTSGMVL